MLLLLLLEVFFAVAAAVVVTAVVVVVAELFVVDSFSLFFATDLQVHEKAAQKRIFPYCVGKANRIKSKS